MDVWSVVRLSRFQLTRQIIGSNRYFWREIGGEKFRTVFCKLRWMFRDLDTPLNMAPLFSGFETKNWKSLQSSSNYLSKRRNNFYIRYEFFIFYFIKYQTYETYPYVEVFTEKKMCVNIIYDFIRIISPYIPRI